MQRISIRRCLSILRNTVYGNELSLPATMPNQKSIVWCVGILEELSSEVSNKEEFRCRLGILWIKY